VRAQFDSRCGLAAAGGAGFHQDATRNFARSAEPLLVGEAVIAAEAADRVTLARHESERGMRSDGVTESPQRAVDGIFPQRRLECGRVKKDIDVLRKSLD
jgi:hypothetical protein